jgi:two-component system chemotaxis response regulator CheY
MRTFIRRVIDLCGIEYSELLQAGHGAAALELLSKHSVDLVLTDINMPVMNGEDLLRTMRSDPRLCRIPVLVVSTDSTQTRVATMTQLGAAGYVKKPFAPEVMREALDRVLQPASTGREVQPCL